jgi:Protein of unknown function (DUF2992).
MKLTVYHDGQYWVGVLEDQNEGKLRAARFVFGSEPQDEEILRFVRTMMGELINQVSEQAEVKSVKRAKVNPKRLARMAAAEVSRKGITTYAQEALKLEHESRQRVRQSLSKQRREELEARKRELKVQKAKAKHRGR